MIADGGGVVADMVHHPEERMHPAILQSAGTRQIVAERIALKNIAIIEQQVVRQLFAGGVDQPGHTRKPDGQVLTILVIVEVTGKHVQI